jgi:hypothetical protein
MNEHNNICISQKIIVFRARRTQLMEPQQAQNITNMGYPFPPLRKMMQKSSATARLDNTDSFNPGLFDVLGGRGEKVQKNPGNVAFRHLIASSKERYIEATRTGKIRIAKDIVAAVRQQDPPGHFLDYDASFGDWVDIGDDKAFDKIRQALRDNNSSSRKKIITSTRSTPSLTESNRAKSEHAEESFRRFSMTHSDSETDHLDSLSPLLIDSDLFPSFCNGTWRNVDEWSLDMDALNDDSDVISMEDALLNSDPDYQYSNPTSAPVTTVSHVTDNTRYVYAAPYAVRPMDRTDMLTFPTASDMRLQGATSPHADHADHNLNGYVYADVISLPMMVDVSPMQRESKLRHFYISSKDDKDALNDESDVISMEDALLNSDPDYQYINPTSAPLTTVSHATDNTRSVRAAPYAVRPMDRTENLTFPTSDMRLQGATSPHADHADYNVNSYMYADVISLPRMVDVSPMQRESELRHFYISSKDDDRELPS